MFVAKFSQNLLQYRLPEILNRQSHQFYFYKIIKQDTILFEAFTKFNKLKSYHLFLLQKTINFMEITDDKLLKIALITSLVGIIGLIIFTPTIEVKEIEIKDITRAMIDEEVKIDCVIQDVSQSSSKNSYFLTVNDGTGQMPLIIFESQAAEIQSDNFDITDFKDKKVEVVGKITEYNSQLELILSSADGLKISS